ncbi:hypothetical protein [Arthrobacter sp. VKM Ac-2550]|uniref:hypothetical protein n=1 Tax=Crystallibacter permensis TaxID=1938888 RepID=UPI0022262B5E|nr:hypothetical protein [Arthrobacter sp. VKM Ac-2550]MCW2132914.1 hypothetical protein [Arthrobacter sp. VKM Ac-2550]
MSGETFLTAALIIIGVGIVLAGATLIYWGTTRHDGVEPDSRPVNIPAPTAEELQVIMHQNISYLDWLDMNGPEQAAARDAYYSAKAF